MRDMTAPGAGFRRARRVPPTRAAPPPTPIGCGCNNEGVADAGWRAAIVMAVTTEPARGRRARVVVLRRVVVLPCVVRSSARRRGLPGSVTGIPTRMAVLHIRIKPRSGHSADCAVPLRSRRAPRPVAASPRPRSPAPGHHGRQLGPAPLRANSHGPEADRFRRETGRRETDRLKARAGPTSGPAISRATTGRRPPWHDLYLFPASCGCRQYLLVDKFSARSTAVSLLAAPSGDSREVSVQMVDRG
jgi:hypothetical protein